MREDEIGGGRKRRKGKPKGHYKKSGYYVFKKERRKESFDILTRENIFNKLKRGKKKEEGKISEEEKEDRNTKFLK